MEKIILEKKHILHYLFINEKEYCICYGTVKDIDKYGMFKHSINTRTGSLGAVPITKEFENIGMI